MLMIKYQTAFKRDDKRIKKRVGLHFHIKASSPYIPPNPEIPISYTAVASRLISVIPLRLASSISISTMRMAIPCPR